MVMTQVANESESQVMIAIDRTRRHVPQRRSRSPHLEALS
ncbi:hypothetical protein GFS60_07649 (plasmid) [Rhodococcus sp. WAY2]|nr:hypothetical protein GFS60_07649 [Rhodococcus sp. WAY2]